MKNNLKIMTSIMNSKRTAILVSLSCLLGFAQMAVLYAAGPAPLNLSSAGNFTILAKSGISTTGTTLIVGDIGVSPVAATFITGFDLILSAESPYSTSALVVGKVYAPGYANPTPVMMTTAISDMETAYTEGAGRTNPTATELGAGNIGGLTLAPGLYKWGTGVIIPTDVILSGSANDVWIFQIAQNLTISSSVKVLLSGGAQASNVFWIVAGQTTLETNSVFNGNILDQTAIVLNTGASLNGRALAQTAVTLDANSVTAPTVSVSATPAIPATPAVPVVTSAIPATPAIPANQNVTTSNASNNASSNASNNTSSNTSSNVSSNVNDTGCLPGNRFSITTGQVCVFTSAVVIDSGCLSGNNFSITTGKSCNPSMLNFGQQIRTIAINLTEGDNNNNVKILQEFLMSQNKGSAARTLTQAGATSYFGSLTRSALAEFQTSVGITPPLGNFGSMTRAYINSH